jgi:hypothetical protein
MKYVTKLHRKEWQVDSYTRLTGVSVQIAMEETAPALRAPRPSKSSSSTTSEYKRLNLMRRRCSHKKETQRASGEMTLTSAIRNHGKQHGSWSTCQICKRRWKWSEEDNEWKVDDLDMPKDKSLKAPPRVPRGSSQRSSASAAQRCSSRKAEHFQMSVDSELTSGEETVDSQDSQVYYPSDSEVMDFAGEY